MVARRWTTERFAEMSWHDNHVYALRIEEAEWGTGRLTLDIDYIEEWLKAEKGLRFKITPARLIFLDVFGLKLTLDYAAVSAGMGPFSIHEIRRVEESRERYVANLWTIAINWPRGEISFQASGFVQEAVGESVICDGQHIPAELRGKFAI
jgi:hypothetical protein